MGIRFHCPNGHKLNVKSFLAGKRGICPHCGAKFVIPIKSPDKKDYRVAELVDSEQPNASDAASTTHAEGVAQPGSEHQADGNRGAAPAESAPESVERARPALAPANQVAESPRQSADVGLEGAFANRDTVDAIAEAPNAIWYVRLASGDQYGPAQSATMSRWLAEGRVSTESLVWREDWPQWKSAASVFPQLLGTVPPMSDSRPAPPVTPPTEPLAAMSESPVVVDAERRSRRRRANRGVWLLVFLIIVVLVLAPFVGYVLWTSS